MQRTFLLKGLFSFLAVATVGLGGVSVAQAAGPTVSPVTPTAATVNQVTTFSVNVTDDSAISYCYLIIDGAGLSTNMSGPTGGLTSAMSQSHTFSAVRSYVVAVRCYDAENNPGQSSDVTVSVSSAAPSVDAVAPLIGTVSPATAVVGTPVTFSATYSDAVGIVGCEFDPGNDTRFETTQSGSVTSGTTSRTHTFSTPGTRTVYLRCADAAGNLGVGSRSVTVSNAAPAGGSIPTVGPVTPLTAVAGTPVTLSSTYNDDVSVESCSVSVNGSLLAGGATLVGSLASGNATRSHTFSAAGSYTVSFTCYDGSGNSGTNGNYTVSVVAPYLADSVFPSFIGSVSPLTVAVNQLTAFSIGYYDNVGVTACFMYVDGALAGGSSSASPAATSGNTSRSHTFTTTGSHTVRFECRDAAGNVSTSSNYSVSVVSGYASDVTSPYVANVVPNYATTNNNTYFQTTATDNQSGISRCELYVNGSSVGNMDISGANVSRYYTFFYPGSYSAYARCWDAAGNVANGPTTTVNVTGTVVPTPGSPSMGGLMKAMCPGYYVGSDHPCRAVYYFGRDGRRHAFPNARVYSTWYADFSGVVEVSDSFLASIPLGRNVTYRPGIRLVKFTTLNRVYAVGRGGILRWITTEEIARQLYGYNWASQVDDIADVFYTNYTFGSDIYSASQFSPSAEAGYAVNIDQNW